MKTICGICPRHCALEPGQTGFCRARANRNGAIVCKNYGRLTAVALDPVEKKPLRRFYPGRSVLSVGSFGCNLRCPFCQNSGISMAGGDAETIYVSPERLAAKAVELSRRTPGNLGVAFTYNEPLVGFEYVRDCAGLVHAAGLKNILVTNGTVCEKPLRKLLPLIDAMNIDLKGFRQDYYDWLLGDLETVKKTIAISARACHVEVTTLIVPGRNDSEEDMDAEAAWLASLDPAIPLHISRFFPRYHTRDLEPTPVDTIKRLCSVARERLKYVYSGNC